MPIMDASYLETDPEGADLLRSVLETGRRGRRRKIADLVGLREKCAAERARPIRIEVGEEPEEELHPAVLAAVAE
jgi:hypothetical protein